MNFIVQCPMSPQGVNSSGAQRRQLPAPTRSAFPRLAPLTRGVWTLLLALGAIVNAVAQPAPFYENNGTLLSPPLPAPNIDALNFLNRGDFVINFTNYLPAMPSDPPPVLLPPYETQNTRNYSNFFGHLMSCNTGFRLEMRNSDTGLRERASSFYNDGNIECGTVNTTNFLTYREGYTGTSNVFLLGLGGSKFIVSASNIVHSGNINVGFENMLSLKGNRIDLTRGSITAEPEGASVSSGSGPGYFFNQGIFDGYWSVGNVSIPAPVYYPGGIIPASHFGGNPVNTPLHPVTSRYNSTLIQGLVLNNPQSYVRDELDNTGSNRFVRAVFINNTNANIQANAYFPFFPDIAIEFTNTLNGFTNVSGGAINNFYVFDWFGVLTNLAIQPHGFARGQATYMPVNYYRSPVIVIGGNLLINEPGPFFEEPGSINSFLGDPATPGPIPVGTFPSIAVTNQWAAYQALLRPVSLVFEDNPVYNATNIPGRMEIIADNYLEMSRARVSSLNYLLLKATNHFAGSSRAKISAPLVDVNLRSTNGLLTVTNLLSPGTSRPEGDVKIYSARWTNVSLIISAISTNTLTNFFHVLVADANFSPTTPTRAQDFILRSTNGVNGGEIIINDNLHVTRSFLLESRRITIATNQPGAATAGGAIFMENSSLVWPTSTPRLQYFTNHGVIQTFNAVFFGGSRSSPYYSSNFNEPYEVFENTGGVTNYSSLIWAKTFINAGTFFASGGQIELQQAQQAILTDGAMYAFNGDIAIQSGSLRVSNHIFQAGHALTLNVANFLDDGSLAGSGTATGNTLFVDRTSAALYNGVAAITNKNTWSSGNGFNLLTRPTQSSLLGTTLTATAAPGRELINQWAAADLLCSPVGFSNNAALGRLILDGGDDSLFTFLGTGANNAIYVDYLELRNFATNRDGAGNYIGLNPEPNVNIYFGEAVANGASIAEKLDGRYGVYGNSGGHFCWVQNFAGYYSSTNIIYPDGTTNTFNAALVRSCNLDSDNDGLVNCSDPTPIQRPQDLALAVALIKQPAPKAEVSWRTLPFASNIVYYKDSFGATNWQVLTNFSSGPLGGRMSVVDPVKSATPRYYRVRVDMNQP